MSIANCKKMIWKLQEENAQLRETLSILVQSVDEDPALIKYFFLANKCRKLKEDDLEIAGGKCAAAGDTFDSGTIC